MKRAITKETYDLLLAAYRECPDNAANAARRASVDPRTARRGWSKGWISSHNRWARPIKVVLEEEQINALAIAAQQEEQKRKEAEELRQKGRDEAVNTMAAEQRLLNQVRSNTGGLLGVTARGLKAMVVLTEKIEEEARTATLSIINRVKLLAALAYATKQANESVKLALEAQRKYVGAPDAILKIDTSTNDMPIDDAVHAIEMANVALQRAQRSGLVLVQGQKAIDVTPAAVPGKTNGTAH